MIGNDGESIGYSGKTVVVSLRLRKTIVDYLNGVRTTYNFKSSLNQLVGQTLETAINRGLVDNILGGADVVLLSENETKNLLEQTRELAKDLGIHEKQDIAKLLSYRLRVSYPAVLGYAEKISKGDT